MIERTALYRTIWRWHFYAGLLVMPMILILSVTGAVYLFKPQIDRFEERAFRHLPAAAPVTPQAQLDVALAAYPGATFHSYRLPEQPGDAAMIHLGLGKGRGMRDVFVSPDGKMVGALDPQRRLSQVVHDIHGQLLMGERGSWLVELAASWAIVMILSGLYLWWPSGRTAAGVVWPRLSVGRRTFWRDLHAVSGFWVSGLALVLLVTALPWTGVWGQALTRIRAEIGSAKGPPDWTIGAAPAGASAQAMHQDHDHAAMMAGDMMAHGHEESDPAPGLGAIVALARREHLAFPVLVTPPGASPAFGSPASEHWTVRSDAQNRSLRTTITYDASGREIGRDRFDEKPAIDRVVAYGVAWHEGQLFGWFNQLVGLATALALIAVTVSGFVMWRRRKPERVLGAPPLPAVPPRIGGVATILLVLAALLPLLALSLIVIWLMERLVLVRIAPLARWLGLVTASG